MKLGKKWRLGRSIVIDRAIRFWLRYLEQEELIKRYQEGYRNKPESIAEIKALEKMAAEAFKEEGLR